MLLTVTNSFEVLIIISLFMGLFDGCFISLLGPIAFEICGQKGATQAIGFLLGLCSVPLTVGPPIAGRQVTVATIPLKHESQFEACHQKNFHSENAG
jgi:MFS family permease